MLDTLKNVGLSDSTELKRTLSALMWLQHYFEGWEEVVRPSLFPLLQYFEESSVRFSSSPTSSSQNQETSAPVEQVATPQIHQESRGSSESLTVTKVNSSKALLDQVRINAAYLREQDDGYWSANKMIRAVPLGRIERHSSASKWSDAFEGSKGRFIGKPESFGSGAAMARFAR